MSDVTLLPAIRSRVGDWMFYSTAMSFHDINSLIKSPDEIHERRGLSNWIQREVIETHADAISTYLRTNEQRFLGALVVGVYDGNPNWIPLDVNYTNDLVSVSESQKNNITGKLGVLQLSGAEKLFAIDGQHRVAGIKKVLEDSTDSNIEIEEVTVIFVSHDASSDEGKQRTRRLFTTLNKKAKRISKASEIALDEDNGFAIITRNLIDTHWLFEDDRCHISYTSSGAITASNETVITSVVGLHELVQDLFTGSRKKQFKEERPSDELLAEHLAFCSDYLDLLLEHCPEYKSAFVDNTSNASEHRVDESNHLLFRPIGQRAFAKATQVLVHRGMDLNGAIIQLLNVNLLITSVDWHHILWDPIDSTMITNKVALAESQLLALSGSPAQSTAKQRNLVELLDAREN